jgi:hypothetical protein
MGDAIVGDVALALQQLVELVGESERTHPNPRPAPPDPPEADPITGSAAMAALAAVRDHGPMDRGRLQGAGHIPRGGRPPPDRGAGRVRNVVGVVAPSPGDAV